MASLKILKQWFDLAVTSYNGRKAVNVTLSHKDMKTIKLKLHHIRHVSCEGLDDEIIITLKTKIKK